MAFTDQSPLEVLDVFFIFNSHIFSFINSYRLTEQAGYVSLTRSKNEMVSRGSQVGA